MSKDKFLREILDSHYDLELVEADLTHGVFTRPKTIPQTDNISILINVHGIYVKSFTSKKQSRYFAFETKKEETLDTVTKAGYDFKYISTKQKTTPYLDKKGVDLNPRGLKNLKAINGKVILRVHDDVGKTVNFQSTDKTGKFFLPNPDKEKRPSLSGAFSVIKYPTDKFNVVYIVEGVATGLSIAKSIPEAGVIVALNDMNAIKVYKELTNLDRLLEKKDADDDVVPIPNYIFKSEQTLFVLCGEYDKKGKKHSPYAKAEYTSLVAFPSELEKGDTDFNDAYLTLGKETIREQLLACDFNERMPIPLGKATIDDKASFFCFSLRTNSVIKLTDNLHTIRASLFSSSLVSKFFVDTKGKQNLEKLYRYLSDNCLLQGQMKNQVPVSYGLRKLGDKFIYNSGNKLYRLKDKEFVPIKYSPKLSRHFKQGACVFTGFSKVEPWGDVKVRKLATVLEQLDFKNKGSAIMLLGFISQSVIRGINMWGGNMHISGSSSTGKSHIKSYIVQKLLPHNKVAIWLDGVDTSRQAVQRDLNGACTGIIAEELENKDASVQDKKVIDSILNLVREGTEGVNNITTKIDNLKTVYLLKCFSFLSFSVEHRIRKRQDLNRFIFLNLIRNPDSKYRTIKPIMKGLIEENPLGYAKKALLNAESFDGIYTHILNYLTTNVSQYNDHKHRNLATNLAGFSIVAGLDKNYFLENNRLDMFDWIYKQYEHTKGDDTIDVVDSFLSMIVPNGLLGNIQQTSLAIACQSYGNYANATSMLKSNKIMYDKEKQKLYFNPTSPILKKILANNEAGINDIKEDLKDFVKPVRFRIDSQQIRGYCIDMSKFPLHLLEDTNEF